MKELLIRFLRDYKAWVDGGALEKEWSRPFSRDNGLCIQFKEWLLHHGYPEEHKYAYGWLGELFVSQGLSRCYPFNFNPKTRYPSVKNGEKEYYNEVYTDTTHLNPRRLAWVTAMIKGELQ